MGSGEKTEMETGVKKVVIVVDVKKSQQARKARELAVPKRSLERLGKYLESDFFEEIPCLNQNQ